MQYEESSRHLSEIVMKGPHDAFQDSGRVASSGAEGWGCVLGDLFLVQQ